MRSIFAVIMIYNSNVFITQPVQILNLLKCKRELNRRRNNYKAVKFNEIVEIDINIRFIRAPEWNFQFQISTMVKKVV